MAAKRKFDAGILDVSNSVPSYSKQEAEALEELLRNKETFRKALHTLTTWLERGECKEDNRNHFKFLIQLCYEHFEKLVAEHKILLKQSEEILLNKWNDVDMQLNGIKGIFQVIEKQDIWGNFTPNQVEEMKKMRTDINNELNVANQIADLKARFAISEKEILKLESQLKESRKQLQTKSTSDVASQYDHQIESEIVSLVSIFLFRNPRVDVDYICLKLKDGLPIKEKEVIENIMRKYPKIFQESSPNEATIRKVWSFASLSQHTLEEFINRK